MFWLPRNISDSEITISQDGIQFCIWGILIFPHKCWETNFEIFGLHFHKLHFWLSIAAFLAFMTLKLKNNESLKYLIPKDPNYVKKL